MSAKSFIPLLMCLFSAIQESQSLPQERIVNGDTIDICQTPWQVSLLLNSTHYCGGSILNNRTILTAAHCIDGFLPVKLKVRAGSAYWKSGGQLLEVKSLLVHEKWDSVKVIHDIGVIRLAQPLTFDECVQPIELPQEDPRAGDAAFVSGWGGIDYENGNIHSEALQGLNTAVLNQETCAAIVSTKGEILSEGTLCTYSTGMGPWDADSGGPLVVNGKLVGVVSRGGYSKYTGTNTPALYTSVAYYYNWIQGAISN